MNLFKLKVIENQLEKKYKLDYREGIDELNIYVQGVERPIKIYDFSTWYEENISYAKGLIEHIIREELLHRMEVSHD
jgi:hypothetical protein